MADYGKSRLGFRFKSSDPGPNPRASSGPEPDSVCRPIIIRPDGRAKPGLVDSPPQYYHHYKETVTTTVEESAYRVQPVSPHTKDYVSSDRKMGFSGGLFHRPRADYGLPELAVTTEGGWARPSLTGWKLPPEAPLEKMTNNVDTIAGYIRGPAGPAPSSGWSGPRTDGRLSRVTNDVDTAAEYLRGPIGSTSAASVGQWSPTRFYSEYGGRKVRATIDSREAVERYGGQFI